MKVREKLMRKVMAVVIAAATIFSISGGTKVVPVKAAGDVAEIVESGVKYAMFEDAVTAAFPGGRMVHLKDRKEDFGYFTQSMKEKDFQAKYEALGEQMLGRIRLV